MCSSRYLFVGGVEAAPLGAQPLGDLWEGQVWVLGPDLLAPCVQEPDVPRDRGLRSIGENLLPLLPLGPAPLLGRLDGDETLSDVPLTFYSNVSIRRSERFVVTCSIRGSVIG